MGKIFDKIKEKLMGGKDKVMNAGEAARDKMATGSSTERASTGSRGQQNIKKIYLLPIQKEKTIR